MAVYSFSSSLPPSVCVYFNGDEEDEEENIIALRFIDDDEGEEAEEEEAGLHIINVEGWVVVMVMWVCFHRILRLLHHSVVVVLVQLLPHVQSSSPADPAPFYSPAGRPPFHRLLRLFLII